MMHSFFLPFTLHIHCYLFLGLFFVVLSCPGLSLKTAYADSTFVVQYVSMMVMIITVNMQYVFADSYMHKTFEREECGVFYSCSSHFYQF